MPKITVSATINAPAEKVWNYYTEPAHIMQWNNASPDWHSPSAVNDLRVGGNFSFRMEAKDGSAGFDFAGTYTEVLPMQKIVYTFGDRNAEVTFDAKGSETIVTVAFDPESENSLELQQGGWQAILDNFKKHVETM